MRCESCGYRAATETVAVQRARVVDTYRVCRTCYTQAGGTPAQVVESIPEPCISCGERLEASPCGVCVRCETAIRRALGVWMRKWRLPSADSIGGRALLLAPHLERTGRPELVHMQTAMRARWPGESGTCPRRQAAK